MKFEKVNIVDWTVVIMLGIALIMTVFFRQEQSASVIASGLIGYIGSTTRTLLQKNERE